MQAAGEDPKELLTLPTIFDFYSEVHSPVLMFHPCYFAIRSHVAQHVYWSWPTSSLTSMLSNGHAAVLAENSPRADR